ncbi:hypothetical protein ACYZUZ_21985 [Klebsiella pneumoniae]|uniref:hypothetical protein n=1 Tax=Klebsiella pneumoniae TaxID=573 RepID=UPI001C67C1C5|nr:hypothetical protein [Klebsiella pneumoniae]
MISLLLIRKHINRRFDLIHKTYQAEISLLSSRIAALESRLSRVEGSAADADGKVSRPWQISKEGNVTLEKAVVETALISSGIITNGKVSSKEAKTSGDTGLRANFGSGRADSNRSSTGAGSSQPQYDSYAGYEGATFSGSVSSHHNHHHGHDCGSTGGYDSGCSDSSFSSGSCD